MPVISGGEDFTVRVSDHNYYDRYVCAERHFSTTSHMVLHTEKSYCHLQQGLTADKFKYSV